TSAAISGSGIGQLVTEPDLVPGRVDLIAPKREVNAGDAGIRVAGDLTIAALRVVGAENIRVGGISTGVPSTSSTSLSGLSGISNIAADAAKSAEKASQQLAASASSLSTPAGLLPSFITVEILGIGEDK